MSNPEAAELMRQLMQRLADERPEYCLALLADTVRMQQPTSGELPSEDELQRLLDEHWPRIAGSRVYAAPLIFLARIVGESHPPNRSAGRDALLAWSGRLRGSLLDELGPLSARPPGDLLRIVPLLGRAWIFGDVPLPPEKSLANLLLIALFLVLDACTALARDGYAWARLSWICASTERLLRSRVLERSDDELTPALDLLEAVIVPAAEFLRHGMLRRSVMPPWATLYRVHGADAERVLRSELPGAVYGEVCSLLAAEHDATATDWRAMSRRLLYRVSRAIDQGQAAGAHTPVPTETPDHTAPEQLRLLELYDEVRRSAAAAALAPGEWQLFELLYVDPQRSAKEISTALGITAGAAGVRAHRMRRKMAGARVSAGM